MPYFAIVHPVLEQLHWRAMPDPPNRNAVWLDIAFAFYHVLVLLLLLQKTWLLLPFIVLMTSSFFWRYTAKKLGGMVVPLLTHIAADTSVIIAVYVLAQ